MQNAGWVIPGQRTMAATREKDSRITRPLRVCANMHMAGTTAEAAALNQARSWTSWWFNTAVYCDTPTIEMTRTCNTESDKCFVSSTIGYIIRNIFLIVIVSVCMIRSSLNTLQ